MKAVRWIWLGFTLLASFIVRSPFRIVENGLSHEPGQNAKGKIFVFLVETFPGSGFVEEQIEQVSISVSQGCSPSFLRSFRPRR